jgi:hypothetical protein
MTISGLDDASTLPAIPSDGQGFISMSLRGAVDVVAYQNFAKPPIQLLLLLFRGKPQAVAETACQQSTAI